MKKHSGFTLIEIVVVIVLIGILSAVALPRFYDFSGQAIQASMEGVAGALNSSMGMAHSMWLVKGKPATLTLDGGTKLSMPGGKPVVANVADCQKLAQGLLSDNSVSFSGGDYTTSFSDGTCTYKHGDSTATEIYSITYASGTGKFVPSKHAS